MTEEELYNEYRKSDCKSFTDFLINKITELKKTYRKQRNKRIDDLQKEITNLKTDYEVLSCSVGDFGELQDKLEEEQRKNNGLSDNLTKAKELLKQWIELYKPKLEGYPITPIQEQTEQFLKDSEVKK